MFENLNLNILKYTSYFRGNNETKRVKHVVSDKKCLFLKTESKNSTQLVFEKRNFRIAGVNPLPQ